jgi:hypothetical protein
MRLLSSVAIALTLALGLGCSSSRKGPPLAATKGRVTYPDGAPAAGIKLVFTPTANGLIVLEAVPAANGAFSIRTLGGKDGAATGTYRVSFEPAPEPESRAVSVAALRKIPRRLMDADSTNLEVKVTAGSDVEITIPAR